MAINTCEKYTAKFKTGASFSVAAQNFKAAAAVIWSHMSDHPEKVRINAVNYVEDIAVDDGAQVQISVGIRDQAGMTIPAQVVDLYGLSAGPNTGVDQSSDVVLFASCNLSGFNSGITATLYDGLTPVAGFAPVAGHPGTWQAVVTPTHDTVYEVRFANIPAGEVYVTGIVCDGTNASIVPADVIPILNGTTQIKAVAIPLPATNPQVRYESSDTSILTLGIPDMNGIVLITGIASGTAIVTASTVDGGFAFSQAITVAPPAPPTPPEPVTGIAWNVQPADIDTDDGTCQASVTFSPVNATDQELVWTSVDPAIATVDQAGLVTAIADGEVAIIATSHDGGFTVFKTITISNQA